MNYVVFYVPKTVNHLRKGYHVGWYSEHVRVSCCGPFKTEKKAQDILSTSFKDKENENTNAKRQR